MKVRVEKPVTWLNSKRDGARNRLMYKTLREGLLSLGLEIEELPITYGHDFDIRCAPSGGFTLSYHSIGNASYVWRVKETPIPFFYSVDKFGYSGWSEFSEQSDLFNHHLKQIQNVNEKLALDFSKDIRDWLFTNNLSKYKQSKKLECLPASFVFLPMQTVNDPVRVHDRLNQVDVLLCAARHAKESKKFLVVKRHPYCKSLYLACLLLYLSLTNPFLILTKASVAYLLDKCSSVLTGNSGVGFEALFYGRPVYTFAASEYDVASEKIKKIRDIENVFKGENSKSLIAEKFLYYYFNQYCFDARDIESVNNCLSSLVQITGRRSWRTSGVNPSRFRIISAIGN